MAELNSLPLFHRIEGQTVLVLGEGEAAEPKKRLVERAGGIVISDQAQAVDEGVRIAFVAFEDPKACEVAAINLRCAGMLVNVVDRPELCDFTTPSILDRNPVLIAVGTGGASAGLAKHLRLRLERILPDSLGKLASALFAARPKLRAQFPDGADRRRVIDEVLAEGGELDPFNPGSHERVGSWVDGSMSAGGSEWHDFNLTSASPDDLTIRQARLLGEADTVCTHGTVPTAILSRARADARRVSCDAQSCPFASASKDSDDLPHCVSGQATGLTVILRWKPEG